MDTATPIVFAAALLAFVAAILPLMRVRETCAGACDRLERLGCEGCPRRARRRRAAGPVGSGDGSAEDQAR